MAHFLGVSLDDITAAVFEDAGNVVAAGDQSESKERTKGPARRADGVVPLLEAAFRLFGWNDEAEAGAALNATSHQVARWRTGAEPMAFADFLTLTSMIGVAAAEAMRGGNARIADISAAADALGVVSGPTISGGSERSRVP
jgi:hypothetical protein